jgi:hypothetical protein
MVGVGAFQEVLDVGRQHSRDVKVVFAEDSGSNIPKLFGKRELCWASWTSNLEGGVSGAEPHSRCREARSLPVIQVSITKSLNSAS